jgi:S1-C subfamily serine protease
MNPDTSPLPDWADAIDPLLAGVLGLVARRRVASAWAWESGWAVTVASAVSARSAVQLVRADGEALHAEVAGIDEATDLALLRADGIAPPPVPMSDRLPRLGTALCVLGRLPSGEAHASFGHVGLVGPRWRTWKGGSVEHRVRLDGGLYPGLPGGPAVDTGGRVLGLASAALSRHHGLLLPAVTVTRVVQALRAGGPVPRAHLGVALQPAEARVDAAPCPGLLVTHVAEASAAARAGVLVGDVIVEAGGRATPCVEVLRDVIDGLGTGAALALGLARGGARVELSVAPWAAPAGVAA